MRCALLILAAIGCSACDIQFTGLGSAPFEPPERTEVGYSITVRVTLDGEPPDSIGVRLGRADAIWIARRMVAGPSHTFTGTAVPGECARLAVAAGVAAADGRWVESERVNVGCGDHVVEFQLTSPPPDSSAP